MSVLLTAVKKKSDKAKQAARFVLLCHHHYIHCVSEKNPESYDYDDIYSLKEADNGILHQYKKNITTTAT